MERSKNPTRKTHCHSCSTCNIFTHKSWKKILETTTFYIWWGKEQSNQQRNHTTRNSTCFLSCTYLVDFSWFQSLFGDLMTSNQAVIQSSVMDRESLCRQEQGCATGGTVLLNRHVLMGSKINLNCTEEQDGGQDEQLVELVLSVEQSRQNSEKGKEAIR